MPLFFLFCSNRPEGPFSRNSGDSGLRWYVEADVSPEGRTIS